MENAEKVVNGLADEIMRQREQMKSIFRQGFLWGAMLSFGLGYGLAKLLSH